ncbi:MAG: FxDxF family PEP-CTERM protein [Burkholderiaceae bacterium]|nr:FxDxF family PEP-CTERM protein [Burkholderiaceae bacterium]
MSLKSRLALTAAALALSLPALAADQSLAFAGDKAEFDDLAGILAGGDDVITFTGLAAGTYDFTLNFSGQYINLSSVTLSGTPVLYGSFFNITAGGLEGQFTVSDATPFQLTLVGTATNASRASYEGTLTVSAVPEPQTYAMLLAGLLGLGAIARRRQA